MKKLALLAVFALAVMACKSEQKKEEVNTDANQEVVAEIAYQSFGEKITDKEVMSSAELYEKYKSLPEGDTVNVKFKAKVKSVCQMKGCWMRVDVGNEESMVRFKDYGFFMPKDIAGDEVIIEGIAFIENLSVEDQKHYAEDAGKSEEEIAQITEPTKTLAFISSGVLLPTEEPEAGNQ
jgi:hypothetical protein